MPTPTDLTTWTARNYGIAETWKLRGGAGGYQDRAINALIENARGIVVAPAGCGKTIIAARGIDAMLIEVMRHFVSRGGVGVRRLLWLANTTEQVEQARTALALIPKRAAVELFVRIVCVTEALEAQLAATSDEDAPDWVIVDECHHGAAPTWKRCIERASRRAKRVWGFTATPHREDGAWPEVETIIGRIVCTVETSEVESGGHRTGGVVRIVEGACGPDLNEEVQRMAFGERVGKSSLVEELWKKSQWQLRKQGGHGAAELRRKVEARAVQACAMKVGIAENKDRIDAASRIASLHVARGQSVLVLVYSVEQGRAIAERVPGARIVFSKMTVREDGRRADIIAGFRDGSIPCLVATSLADEGFDAPRASVLVNAAGGRGISKTEDATTGERRVSSRLDQRTGRVLRAFEGKQEGTIYDFADEHHRFLAAQAKTRKKGYGALGFAVSTVSAASAVGAMIDDSADLFREERRAVVA